MVSSFLQLIFIFQKMTRATEMRLLFAKKSKKHQRLTQNADKYKHKYIIYTHMNI